MIALTRSGGCALIPRATTFGPVDEHLGPTHYVIRVRGVLSDRLLTAFPSLRSRTDRGDTILAGGLPDQAALHGVLAQIEALGLVLLEVRRARR